MERALRDLGFARLVIARPSLLTGERRSLGQPTRPAEALSLIHIYTVLICVGRLAPEKNLGALVAAWQAMREQDPDVRLVLVGDGPERARLQQRCPAAVFAGVRRGEDLAVHYASADVFVFPSLTETFGNVVPEAMASGLAVLGHQYAAAAQLVRHEENGLLVPFGDDQAFVAMARGLAGQRERIQALGQAARLTLSLIHI